ncbi:MAG TPA: PPOX class F420-dependent oxidoreductase [Thermoflexales bacterium]|nr:PPOX class F420-dependent oxidoreductase [Thermoflexales bacterium]HQW34474.1 PPOX class F420-dependent oxidoreductase [Thermoflexales bacterium]HQZ22843.1 PPOX class F420-dependent oxidoreductase [Thermoflexales bacterium]HRA00176.1 PPOX class F420-dependent oxidoreductase [Thermoflexales bacterium]
MSIPQDIQNAQFISLETYRKNGQAMPTPVWFVEKEGVLYVKTQIGAGKAKRIKNNGAVRIAPCDVRGNVQGEWVNAQAHLMPITPEPKDLLGLWTKKYGAMNVMFEVRQKLKKVSPQVIEIKLS